MPRTAQQPSLSIGRKPTHRLYRVLGDGDHASWTPIGAAWPNKDGKGFNLTCDAIPLTGRRAADSHDPCAARQGLRPGRVVELQSIPGGGRPQHISGTMGARRGALEQSGAIGWFRTGNPKRDLP